MLKPDFDPPPELQGILIETLDDATEFIRGYSGSRAPVSKEIVRQKVEQAATPAKRKMAVETFLIWAEAEGLLSNSN